ncbi:MAG: cell division protein ZapE [Pseudohongiellaceae bacterium]
MTPKERYQHDIDCGLISPDPAQRAALIFLQHLHQQLVGQTAARPSWLCAVKDWLFGKPGYASAIKSVYLWGGVGRGKTYLMDIFYEALPAEIRLRTHFHRFMQQVHRELAKLKGEKNPLIKVADYFARQARVICFDEFFVQDIGDAMILGGLLEELFSRDVVLIMTSNIKPDRLYENGLQRDRFLPAIRLINSQAEVVHMEGAIDHRLRRLVQTRLYHWPLGEDAELQLGESFRRLAPDFQDAVKAEVIEILGRRIPTRYCADDVVWFDFEQLCGGPRSAFDYIEIARIYHAVLLSNVPLLDGGRDDQARRFINLVDELYDHNVKLILSAAVPLHNLYQGGGLVEVFQRTRSRLQEMQSEDYLARAHKP